MNELDLNKVIDKLDTDWKKLFKTKKFQKIIKKIERNLRDYDISKICPRIDKIFNAFNYFNIRDTRVVIIGQDPYYSTVDAADGLAFSCNKMTPSLRNIFDRIESLFNRRRTKTTLDDWAEQGVLLINTMLTTVVGEARAHHHVGWYDFTIEVINFLSMAKKGIVYLAWGKNARYLVNGVDDKKNTILMTSHPSPLSAYRGFLETECFIECNLKLDKPIRWHDPHDPHDPQVSVNQHKSIILVLDQDDQDKPHESTLLTLRYVYGSIRSE